MYLWQNLEIFSKLVIFSTNSLFAMFLQIRVITPYQQVGNLARAYICAMEADFKMVTCRRVALRVVVVDAATLGDMSLYSSAAQEVPAQTQKQNWLLTCHRRIT